MVGIPLARGNLIRREFIKKTPISDHLFSIWLKELSILFQSLTIAFNVICYLAQYLVEEGSSWSQIMLTKARHVGKSSPWAIIPKLGILGRDKFCLISLEWKKGKSLPLPNGKSLKSFFNDILCLDIDKWFFYSVQKFDKKWWLLLLSSRIIQILSLKNLKVWNNFIVLLKMSNLANYSPYNKTYKFLLFQNQAYHERNKKEAKPCIRSNLRYARPSTSSFVSNP